MNVKVKHHWVVIALLDSVYVAGVLLGDHVMPVKRVQTTCGQIVSCVMKIVTTYGTIV